MQGRAGRHYLAISPRAVAERRKRASYFQLWWIATAESTEVRSRLRWYMQGLEIRTRRSSGWRRQLKIGRLPSTGRSRALRSSAATRASNGFVLASAFRAGSVGRVEAGRPTRQAVWSREIRWH